MIRSNPQKLSADDRITVTRPIAPTADDILSPDALRFVAHLVRRFRATRDELLKLRTIRQREIDAGHYPDFLRDTAAIRRAEWTIAPLPEDLRPAPLFMAVAAERESIFDAVDITNHIVIADFEDASSPTWDNCMGGHANLRDALARDGSHAPVLVRPRGWHLDERHIRIDDEPAPAALVDFGLYVFHNAAVLADAGHRPCFHLPKLEGHLEARLWNEVFTAAEDALGMTRGNIRAAVLIETILAAFEIDEILYELRDHSAGLDCGVWDYVFSLVKRFREHPGFVLPDRDRVVGDEHLVGACAGLLAATSRRRGVTLWCGAGRPAAANVSARDLLSVPRGSVTERGLRRNVRVGITYLESWLRGTGYVSIDGAMEDTATAEISRAQVWQWIRHGIRLDDGRPVTPGLLRAIVDDELDAVRAQRSAQGGDDDAASGRRFDLAAKLFLELAGTDDFPEFLTLSAYDYLD